MQRLLVILLLPFFVVGNSFANAHCVTARSSPSHSRAHIHIGSSSQHGHDHHGHQPAESHAHTHDGHGRDHERHDHERHDHENHASQLSVFKGPVDHDSDAVYVVAVDLWISSINLGSLLLGLQPSVVGGNYCLSTIRSAVWEELRRSLLGSTTRLYLLHAALRL
jgi:hypothetical protein